METFTICSLQELEKLALGLKTKMRAGEVYGFRGPRGAGKTTLIQALGRSFGITVPMASPTFVFRKEYRLPKLDGDIRKIIHLDCYRIENGNAEDLGDLMESEAVTFIEWPERIGARLPSKITSIEIEIQKNDQRVIRICQS